MQGYRVSEKLGPNLNARNKIFMLAGCGSYFQYLVNEYLKYLIIGFYL